MPLIDFQSGREIDKNREWERSVRQSILDKAKEKYERKQRLEKEAKERGEDTWMLPSVEAKIDSKKNKKSKKEKKKSKHKKHKKRKSHSSSSESDEDEKMWVEKTEESAQRMQKKADPPGEPVKRDQWMEMTSLFRTHTRDEIKIMDGTSRTIKKLEERIKKEEANKPGSQNRELNPYYKEGGIGLPLDEMTPSVKKSVTTYDALWLRKALRRAEDQAKEEGRTLEEVAKDRWGSLENFKKLLNDAEEKTMSHEMTSKNERNTRDSRTDLERSGERSADRNNRDWQRRRSRSIEKQRNRSRERKKSESKDRQRSSSKDRQNKDKYMQRSRSRSRDRQNARSENRNYQSNTNNESQRSNCKDRSNEQASSSNRSTKERGQSKSLDSSNTSTCKLTRSSKKDYHQERESKATTVIRESKKRYRNSSASSDSSNDSFSRTRNYSTSKNKDSVKIKSSSYREDDRSGKQSGMLRPQSDDEEPSTTASSVVNAFRKPSNSPGFSETNSYIGSNWRKKTDLSVKKIEDKSTVPVNSSSSSSSSSDSEEEEKEAHIEPIKLKEELDSTKAPILTDKEMNQLAAKLTKAELLGNEGLVTKLKKKLNAARLAKSEEKKDELTIGESKVTAMTTEEVILTKTDASGFTRPVLHRERDGKGKKKKKESMYNKAGERTRYFPDDDEYDLKTMFEKEKNTTAKEQLAMFERISTTEKLNDDFDVDDMFMSNVAPREDADKQEERERKLAIKEHQRTQKTMDSCHFCVGNKVMKKHLIVALGTKCYVSVPHHFSLTEGHCFIVPIHHVMCGTMADEDLWEEIMDYRKAIFRMFEFRGQDCVFFETVMQMRNMPHMVIQCVPLEKEIGDLAPIYFKKAIQECDDEWSQNKKLIDLKGRSARKAVPKGLPYFSVDFGMTPGFAHVIENESIFPKNFALEIIGGMIDADISLFRKPKTENFDTQRKKVLQFADMFKEFDPQPQ